MLIPGQPAPWFHAKALGGNDRYAFSSAAGRWMLMLFMGSGADEAPQEALRLLRAHRDMFDDDRACFFGVTVDPSDVDRGRIAQEMPGIRWFLDYDRAISTSYGAARVEAERVTYAPHWLLLDPMMRVRSRATLVDGPAIFADLRERLNRAVESSPAPVLIIPEVLPPETCRRLVGLYELHGGTDSGFMREESGITVHQIDYEHKRRADYTIDDELLVSELKARLSVGLKPMIQRAFQFDATRIERWIVACYDARDAGHFRPHRDNTTKGTAHRRFACTVNLNADDYEGGDLRFPEFGAQTYRAPTGGAVVFSCSLLHEALPVTHGKRYAFLPFLYDDAAARVRERNLQYLSPELAVYGSGLPPESSAARTA